MAPADRENRPSPDALLAEAHREGRGKLKIFLGAAPGVGKTYAMLEAARERARDGVDVAVAVVETHGRRETEALVHGLDVVPKRTLEYRGRDFEEMDLDGVLARRPALALVDELAHTNISGSRHLKRWQDVQELLDVGIDVYTTLNVQHLESLNDVVERISGVRVRETLPDSVLQQADEIKLIDLAPEDLLKRLEEGKVYVPDQARRAANAFFSRGNLTALREMALRQAAERVDAQMISYMHAHAIQGPWPARERLMACIGDDLAAESVVRLAARSAERRQAPWIAVYIETARHLSLSEEVKDRIARALRLAEELGGEATTVQGDDVVAEVLSFAKARNITQIIIGRPRRHRQRWFGGGDTAKALLARAEAFNVTVIGRENASPSPIARIRRDMPKDWLGYGLATLAVALATGFSVLIDMWMPVPNISVAYLMAVLLVAMRLGLAPSIFASLLSFLIYSFLFTEPRLTLAITDSHNILTMVFFLVAAVIVSNLGSRLREQVQATRLSARRTGTLYDFSRKIAAAATQDDVLWAVVHHVASTIHGQSLILLPENDRLAIKAGYPPEDTLDDKAAAAAEWAWTHGTRAGAGSATLPTSPWLFLPLKTVRGPVGVMGVQMAGAGIPPPSEARLLETLADQAAVAIERTALVADIEAARVAGERDRLRTALLSSLSHDLRTPLVSIMGSASALVNYQDTLSDDAERELALTIQDEAERLNRFVQNLLDMTKLGAGALKPRIDWADFRDIVGGALERAKRLIGQRKVRIDLSDDFPLLCVDSVLMEQVVFNLIDNACKYTPPGSAITVWGRPRRDKVVVEICDQGPGIPEADREQVFDMFYRVKAQDAQIAGTGLGLAICRGLVEAHGGTIAAEPGINDCGTCIVITLPLLVEPELLGAEEKV
ncbi:osmosensitive K+ channel Signal transduction histidine kinase [Rhodospirillum rubrum F11]|uniref:histidine kinase n=3 Tax=Rhodospirillum rubrum TaxID=1085 RepID=Q2RV86_RHORT|nr:sensor histidine kinase KdpD [Rhodospirillum rubrum]ABC21959.1 osmosensitive K+ channel signal transduction histidine kinase [Rhodospirillum rubrum ATCC 11170]AEO47668.1 osmosensitive K+ channel Signal transduction histidine kinase [Rhodospirillum rubrum F11]MBK5953529.1 two-component sensor histidine kinase [Rhodospirillum rubrum]QXG81615.1 sensor histidine kinase KdpD [Rhodospirillum rubrum]